MSISVGELDSLRLLASIKKPYLSDQDGWGKLESVPGNGIRLICYICDEVLPASYNTIEPVESHGKFHLNDLMNKFSVEEIHALEAITKSRNWWKINDSHIFCKICNMNMGSVVPFNDQIYEQVLIHGRKHLALISFL